MRETQTHPDIESLLIGIKNRREELSHRLKIGIEGLDLFLHAQDRAMNEWVFRYLHPLSNGAGAGKDSRRQDIYLIANDDLVTLAIAECLKIHAYDSVQGYKLVSILRMDLPGGERIQIEPHSGVVWFSEPDQSCLTILVSSRTRWPALEFSRATREMITYHFESCGWSQLHAGGVVLDGSPILFVGSKKAGKTTLLLTLMNEGAAHISNDRTYVRHRNQDIEILGYPMAIAVGLGTALQFPPLRKFIRNPDALVYPRRRLDLETVARTPTDQLHTLRDKIDFLPDEMTPLLDSPPPCRGGTLNLLILPHVLHTECDPSTRELSRSELAEVLRENCFRDPDYPDFLSMTPPTTTSSSEILEALLEFPAIELRYSAVNNEQYGRRVSDLIRKHLR